MMSSSTPNQLRWREPTVVGRARRLEELATLEFRRMAIRTGILSAVIIAACAVAAHQLRMPLVPLLAKSIFGTLLVFGSIALHLAVHRVTPTWISLTSNGLMTQTLLGSTILPFSGMESIEVVDAQPQPLIRVHPSPRFGKPGQPRTYGLAPRRPVEELVRLLQLHAPLSHCDVLVHDGGST